MGELGNFNSSAVDVVLEMSFTTTDMKWLAGYFNFKKLQKPNK